MLRLLAKNREDRPRNVDDVLTLLSAVQHVPQARRETVREVTMPDVQVPPVRKVTFPEPRPHPEPIAQDADGADEVEQKRMLPRWLWIPTAGVLAVIAAAMVAGFSLEPEKIFRYAGSLEKTPFGNPLTNLACTRGFHPACNIVGRKDAFGIGVAQDYARAAKAYRVGCDYDDGAICSYLGDLYHEGHGVARDDAQAVALYSKACNGGLAIGCGNLARMYHDGTGVEKDLDRAEDLFQNACEAGDASSCDEFGLLVKEGHGIPRSSQGLGPQSATYPKVLWFLGFLTYSPGTGPSLANEKAFDYFFKSCGAGAQIGCLGLGYMYESGESNGAMMRYPLKAATVYSGACGAHIARGCGRQGALYRDGNGVAKDIETARRLFDKDCVLGDSWGCQRLKELE